MRTRRGSQAKSRRGDPAPRRPAPGEASAWLDKSEKLRAARPYLAVQDGMTSEQVARSLHRFDGVFVGGTLPWKLDTGFSWVSLAHEHGKRCHVGRVGTPDRLAWAREIGADSVDSSQPLWTNSKWSQFLAEALRPVPQGRLF